MNVYTGGYIVWSVNIMIGILLLGVLWILYKIFTLDNEEQNSSSSHHSSSSDE
jgi:hypothetical protein